MFFAAEMLHSCWKATHIIGAGQTGKIISAAREIAVSRHNGGPIEKPLNPSIRKCCNFWGTSGDLQLRPQWYRETPVPRRAVRLIVVFFAVRVGGCNFAARRISWSGSRMEIISLSQGWIQAYPSPWTI